MLGRAMEKPLGDSRKYCVTFFLSDKHKKTIWPVNIATPLTWELYLFERCDKTIRDAIDENMRLGAKLDESSIQKLDRTLFPYPEVCY